MIKKISLFLVFSYFLSSCSSVPSISSFKKNSEAVSSGVDTAESIDVSNNTLDLESVFYFDFDQDNLTMKTRNALDAQVSFLRNGSSNIRLEGHADERGSREYNLALGESRAKAVADYLVIQGISRSRIDMVSYGEEQPVSLESSESAYKLNRRVELK